MCPKLSVVFLLSFSCLGCVHVRNAIHNTMADTLDLVRADVSFSVGTDMGAHVMATKYAQLKSYSYEDLYRVGLGTRVAGVWEEERQDWWIGPKHASRIRMNRQDVAMVSAKLPAKLLAGPDAVFDLVAESKDEVGLGLHGFLVGVRFGVRPLEIVDFFANFVGLDLSGDNLSIRERFAIEAAEEAARKKAKEAAQSRDDSEPTTESTEPH